MCSSWKTERGVHSFQMQIHLRCPLVAGRPGSAYCVPAGKSPIIFEWRPLKGSLPPTLDETGSEALEIHVGEYLVKAVDGEGKVCESHLRVLPCIENAVVVEGYDMEPATTTRSRDGSVVAILSGNTEGVSFLWSNGVTSAEPRLQNVPCGKYSLTAMGPGGKHVPTIHLCYPCEILLR